MPSELTKLVMFPLLMTLGCVVAGLYGAMHDQVSYSVSPDYFHAFKFHQFRIPPERQNRVGAALVGWQATWWMGAIIGVPLLTAGLLLPGTGAYCKHCLIAFLVVVATAMLVGLAALAFAYQTITPEHLPHFSFPKRVDQVAFSRAGVMHNFSYLGGFLGIATGLIYLAWARWRGVAVVA